MTPTSPRCSATRPGGRAAPSRAAALSPCSAETADRPPRSAWQKNARRGAVRDAKSSQNQALCCSFSMRLGVAWLHIAAAYYRAIDVMEAMERRGHQVVWPADGHGTLDLARLQGCDVVHVYRRCDDPSRQILAELKRRGTAITYDNDDDLTAVPKESPNFRELGGLEGQRSFMRSVKAARIADVFTVTSEVLAEKYRKAGVERVEI